MTAERMRAFSGAAVALALLAATLATAPPAAASEGVLRLETVSNRADLVSGGDVLIRVTPPRGSGAAGVSYAVNGRGVAGALRPEGNRRGLLALVSGLRNGKNTIIATGGGQRAELTVINHRIGGPVFAGKQVKPWRCTTEENGLGPPKDKWCNAPTRLTYMYKTDNPQAPFAPYDPANPPATVPTTTTDQGVTVPYIIRVERGTLDRSIYEIAVLADPKESWTPSHPQRAWNHKLHVPFGGGCAAHHQQTTPGTLAFDDFALSRGFAVASSGLNTLSQNCNEVVSAEAVMMIKERVIETLGTIRYTFGKGGSGGSVQQQNIAASYPGLLDGILPGASYPDVWTTANEIFECTSLFRYFNEVSPHLWAIPSQRAAVAGHAHADTACPSWVAAFAPAFEPTGSGAFGLGLNDNGCAVPADQRYDPETNPDGVRCAISDYDVAIFGKRHDGVAKRAMDNVGVQYGLNALNSRLITPEQFVDLNQKIGGLDRDFRPQPQRTTADVGALEIAYRSGRVSDARQLAKVPMIDLRIPENEEIHQHYYSYTMRARLDLANGTHANQIIWTGGGSDNDAFVLMDKWLSRIESDKSSTPLRLKVIRNKPAEAVDACGIGSYLVSDTSTCKVAFPYYSNPRIAAGGPFANNVLKCRTKPLDRSDYRVSFNDAQWRRLKTAFPTGVCDWNRSGIGQQPVVPWLTYKGGPGGKPLGSPPQTRLVPRP